MHVMKSKTLSPLSREAHERVLQAIREMSADELIAFMEYREPGIPETDMIGDLLEMYRERREQREAENRVMNKNAA